MPNPLLTAPTGWTKLTDLEFDAAGVEFAHRLDRSAQLGQHFFKLGKRDLQLYALLVGEVDISELPSRRVAPSSPGSGTRRKSVHAGDDESSGRVLP